jgi:hypothetical protein
LTPMPRAGLLDPDILDFHNVYLPEQFCCSTVATLGA